MKVAALALALVGFTAAQMSLPIPDGALLGEYFTLSVLIIYLSIHLSVIHLTII